MEAKYKTPHFLHLDKTCQLSDKLVSLNFSKEQSKAKLLKQYCNSSALEWNVMEP